MQNFTQRHFTRSVLTQYGLPDIPYPIPTVNADAVDPQNGDLPLGLMLYGLQQHMQEGDANWKQFEQVIDRLANC